MELSQADKFKALPEAEKTARVAQLSLAEAEALMHDWDFWARPSQKLPLGDWATWMVCAGRGFGKTRVGAETTRVWARDFPIVNIAGPTAWDARNVMVEGPSGILACCRPGEVEWEPAKRKLSWSSGAKTLVFSADEPERFRGPQHNKFWGDEVAAWQYEEAWDQAMFGLRLGSNPQALVTSTPKPTRLVKEILKDKSTILTRGSTYDNRGNLAKRFYETIIKKYEGTRLGRQELLAELLEDNPNALWRRAQIDALRVPGPWNALNLRRVVVAIDPAVSANADSDETGIVVAGADWSWPPHYFVWFDDSGIYKPHEWGEKGVAAFKNYGADRIIGEINNGGDLVESNLRAFDHGLCYRGVHASRGKATRAEPVAGLYEQGRVHHVGSLARLEDEQCDFDPTIPPEKQRSPNRMDALVWAIWELAGLGQPEPVNTVVEHEEHVRISPGLDELEDRISGYMG